MRCVTLGNTDVRVSALTLGTMTFGTPVAEPEAAAIVRAAPEMGVISIDTANMYEGYARYAGSAGGVAEEIVGRAVRGRRGEYTIATKVGMKVGPAPEDEYTSPEAIRVQLERSLRRLGTDYVDIYYLHRFDPVTPPEDIARAMGEAVRAGKARAWGVSNYDAGQLEALCAAAQAVGAPLPAVCQPPLSLLKRDALHDLLPLCARLGISAAPYQVYQGGLLTGKYRRGEALPDGSRAQEKPDWLELSDALYDQLEALEREAAARGLSLSRYALRWALEQPAVATVLMGVKSAEQLRRAADAVK